MSSPYFIRGFTPDFDRQSGTLKIAVSYVIQPYSNPFTHFTSARTSWSYDIRGTNMAVNGSGEGSAAPTIRTAVEVQQTAGPQRFSFSFHAENTYSGAAVDLALNLLIDVYSAGDVIIGGTAGDDLIVAGVGDDVLRGGSGSDYLAGDSGDDILVGGGDRAGDRLDGGAGADRMYGGFGNDRYRVNSRGDRVIERADADPNNKDIVEASVDHVLAANVEALWLLGAAGLNGGGNALDNQLGGNDGANRLSGFGGRDELHGKGGADILLGGAGNDVLYGGEDLDEDRLAGGSGDDHYYGLAGDRIVEAAGGGTDFVWTHEAFFALPDHVENLDASGRGTGSFRGLGNSGDNVIAGSFFADDRLAGRGGADTLSGSGGRDVLAGGGGTDTFGFALESDVDKVTDFRAGADGERLALDLGSAFDTIEEVMAVAVFSGDRVVFDFGDGDRLILLGRFTESSFDPANFVFG